MIPWFWLFIPGLIAWLNRTWRGEGNTPFGKWFWFASLTCCAYAMTLNLVFAASWLFFCLGYCLLGWHAMFSAITGRPPGRKDSPKTQWMQDAAYQALSMARPPYFPGIDDDGGTIEILSPHYVTPYDPAKWKRFGVVYGGIRGLLMLPGVAWLIWATQSLLPLLGVIIATGMGAVYFLGGRIVQKYQLPEDKAVLIAEVMMGWLIGTYLLVCAGEISYF